MYDCIDFLSSLCRIDIQKAYRILFDIAEEMIFKLFLGKYLQHQLTTIKKHSNRKMNTTNIATISFSSGDKIAMKKEKIQNKNALHTLS